MRIIASLIAGLTLLSSSVVAQPPAEPFQPVATMKQIMVEIIHPAANEILLAINRGGPDGESEWAALRRSAMTLAESGNLLITRNRADDWVKDAKLLIAAGAAAYKAAQAKDRDALGALGDLIDASCTTCHKQFRPNVFLPAR